MTANTVVKQKKTGLVFSKKEMNPIGYCRADKAIKRMCKKVGIKLISWHVLRHTFAHSWSSVRYRYTRHNNFLVTQASRWPSVAPTLHRQHSLIQLQFWKSLEGMKRQIVGGMLAVTFRQIEKRLFPDDLLVPRGRIELPTRGFSVHCSTTELPRRD